MAELGRAELVKRIKSLLISGNYSDFVITCGSDTYKVHKAVICSQSGFFEKAESFPVGKEAAEGAVNLLADEAKVVRLLIDFLYEGDYEPKLPVNDSEQIALKEDATIYQNYHYKFPHTCKKICMERKVCWHHVCDDLSCKNDCRNFICKECTGMEALDPADLLLHAQMAAIADKYDIHGLALVAREKFAYYCVNFWDHEMFLEAAECGLSFARDDADYGLTNVLRETIVAHPELLEQARIQAAMEMHSEFAFQVVKQQARELSRARAAGFR